MVRKKIDSERKTPKKKKKVREFVPENREISSVSSPETIKRAETAAQIPIEDERNYLSAKSIQESVAAALDVDANDLSEDPIFKELSEPKLPALPKENRARLQMQSPTRVHFYWSVKNNPFQTLRKIFGKNTGNYTLVIKLVNQMRYAEEIIPVEAEGSTWFDVDADATYRAEIGFYAPYRPFIRLMFSNMVRTPRRSPSPRRDYSPHFTVSANQFAEVLDVSGFRQDAFEVALAGDDTMFTETATQNAFSQFVGDQKIDFGKNDSGEIRFALLALASGILLENLRGQISKNLFHALQKHSEKLSAEKALAALRENFGVFSGEITEEELFAPAVFGVSLINFPRGSKKRFIPKFAPVSSF